MTYKEAEIICQEYLKTIENIKKFCEENGLPYFSVVKLKNGNTSKPFPKLVKKIFSNVLKDNTTITITKNYGND